MATEQLPKEFEKTTEVLPFSKYGLSSFEDIKKAEKEVQHLECLKKLGLTNDEIKLYQDNEAGVLDEHKKVESSVLKAQLESVYRKVNAHHIGPGSSKQSDESSSSKTMDLFALLQQKTITFYPEGHPMNDINELEQSLFGHLKNDIIPITKRRKMLRRLERRKERILGQEKQLVSTIETTSNIPRKHSLWDLKEKPSRAQKNDRQKPIVGSKQQILYTIKDGKIVRLEPVKQEERIEECRDTSINQEYRAVDIVIPVNSAEEQILEGTKMCVDDIKKMERFKDYEPGVPSKVLYLKNIASLVTQDQLSMLFNQFQMENGGRIDVRLMSGRMRGQAFVSFQNENLAIRALDEVNGTILSGKPVVIQFGRNSNRIQDDNR